MAKQTFTTGQVLTAAQMTSLQQTAMLGGAASAKTASYTLVAADAGTAISMSNASATTITVNTGLFADGDTVQITNIGTGICTITAGTATVNTASSLVLAQWESGTLDFRSSSAAVFIKAAGAPAGGGGKVLQVVQGTYATATTIATNTYTDTGLSLSITPTSATSKVLVMINQAFWYSRSATSQGTSIQILRGATSVFASGADDTFYMNAGTDGTGILLGTVGALVYLDSPATTSATTYKTQGRSLRTSLSAQVVFQPDSNKTSVITLMEIGA